MSRPMIEWHDDAIVLAARPHGEDAALVQALTATHGRHAGLVRGGQSRRARGTYEPGTLVRARWRARLAEHLGQYSCEAVTSPAAALMAAPGPLAALASAMALAEASLPERASHPGVYAGTRALLFALDGAHWAEAYVQWEVSLLRELGFGLDLSCCAGGGNDRLAYVSPRSGRAVSLSAGAPYRDRLLTLPGFLVGDGAGGAAEVAAGLRLTGHFLARHILAPAERSLPAARDRLVARFAAPDGSVEPAAPIL